VRQIQQCTEITLKPVHQGITYAAGQFVFVAFHNKKVGAESHPFSLASPSGQGTLRIIAKNLGDYTSRLSFLRKFWWF
jgi:predicted ferric reductase